ncbi:hypothetical protein PVL29_005268 [Vitis rotundifolia]|uniref:RING-type domain-containing protein n=1 Tax=Vitis rotundifolia TaxID=103349 RepID=A0AA39ABE9_VITRO|nr:hypothetical protein PVL29_005268 [Vitis rotundifolia]
MGIFCVAIKMPKSINVVFLLNLLGYFKVIIMVALAHLGLFHPPEQAYSEEHPASTYVVVMDGQTPSLVPVPVVMAWIKKRVPVVEYGSFLERLGMHEDEDAVCSVCLDCIKRSHEIRELSNCCHVFHKECLDTWVDEGQALSLSNGTKAIYLDDDSAIISGDWDLERRIAYVFVMERQTPSLVPVAVVMAWVKKRVPVVECGSLLERLGTKEEDGDTACPVCLDRIKRSHEIRELPNCCPVFHKDCLDT